MEAIIQAVAAGFVGGLVIQTLVTFWMIHWILTRQKQRDTERETLCYQERRDLSEKLTAAEDFHRGERAKLDERVTNQAKLYQLERDKLNHAMAAQTDIHQRERRELYERLQGTPVHIESLLTDEGELGKNKGVARDQDSDEMSPEQLARLKIQENSDGGFIDMNTGVLYENVKALLHYRQEAVEEKKGLTEKIE